MACVRAGDGGAPTHQPDHDEACLSVASAFPSKRGNRAAIAKEVAVPVSLRAAGVEYQKMLRSDGYLAI